MLIVLCTRSIAEEDTIDYGNSNFDALHEELVIGMNTFANDVSGNQPGKHVVSSGIESQPANPSDVEDVFDLVRSISSEVFLFGGEGGVALFDTGSKGPFPNTEFRPDEFLLFLDVKLGEGVYLFAEMILIEREDVEPEDELNAELGELYIEIEQGLFKARFGRFDIPFGEEYLTRDAIDNPLISHSITDFWGTDEGIEIFGQSGFVDYVLAVHNEERFIRSAARIDRNGRAGSVIEQHFG